MQRNGLMITSVLASTLLVCCAEEAAQAPDESSLLEEGATEDRDPAESSAGLRKANGGVSGQGDYCDSGGCTGGEGDCDSTAQCATGFVCLTDNGGRYAGPFQNQQDDHCALSRCNNRTLDPGEVGVDCDDTAAGCGLCSPNCELADGHADRCTYHCQCASGEGDCDANDNCIGGLGAVPASVCVPDVGFRFNMPATNDVCLARTCNNGALDPGETAIDCGGACGPCNCNLQSTVPGSECTPGCPCSLGGGDCDKNADCETGLVCAEEGTVDRCRAGGPAPACLLSSFWAAAFIDGPQNGIITRHSINPPHAIEAQTPVQFQVNGALAFDRVGNTLYGGHCCAVATNTIFALDPATLVRIPARDIVLPHNPSLAIEIDTNRRLLFLLETFARRLTAVSLDNANYGAVVAQIPSVPINPGPGVTDVGDQITVDTQGRRVFITGGDGGPIFAVDYSGLTSAGGAFGSVVFTGQTNRSTGNSGGGLAIDVTGRRVFFFPGGPVVRAFSADPPFGTLANIAIGVGVGGNDNGLFHDSRTNTLYIGRSAASPVAKDLDTSVETLIPFPGGTIPGLSFAACNP